MARKKNVSDELINEVDELEDAIESSDAEQEERNREKDWKLIIEAYDDLVYEDAVHIQSICNTANIIIHDRFRIWLSDPKESVRFGYKMGAVIFAVTFEAIKNELLNIREKKSSFQINLADRLIVGFTNQASEEDEKTGNYMFFVKNIDHHTVEAEDMEYKTASQAREYITSWNQENMVKQPDVTRRIAAYAVESLKKLKINIGNPEYIFPIFITIYETIVNYVKIQRREMNEEEFEINFCSCFFIKAMEQDDGVDKIIIRPSIETKMALKSDKSGSSIYE